MNDEQRLMNKRIDNIIKINRLYMFTNLYGKKTLLLHTHTYTHAPRVMVNSHLTSCSFCGQSIRKESEMRRRTRSSSLDDAESIIFSEE